MSSTNKTTYYELPQFVDDDIFNPLVDDNDAYQKIDTALHNIADAEADDASEIVGVKSRVTTAEGKIEALETQNGVEVLTTTAQTLSGAVNELDSGVSSLDGKLDVIEDDINNVNTGLKVKVSALETQNGSEVLTTTAQTLSGAVNELDGDVADIKAQNGNEVLTTTAQTLSGAINELKDDIAYVTPEMFGAVGDGVADDTQALADAIEYGNSHNLPVKIKKVKITDAIRFRGDISGGEIIMADDAHIYVSSDGIQNNCIHNIYFNVKNFEGIVLEVKSDHTNIYGCEFIGSDNDTVYPPPNVIAIYLTPYISDTEPYYIFTNKGLWGIHIDKNFFRGVNTCIRMYLPNDNGAWISDVEVTNNSGLWHYKSIDIECDNDSIVNCDGIALYNNAFSDNYTSDIIRYGLKIKNANGHVVSRTNQFFSDGDDTNYYGYFYENAKATSKNQGAIGGQYYSLLHSQYGGLITDTGTDGKSNFVEGLTVKNSNFSNMPDIYGIAKNILINASFINKPAIVAYSNNHLVYTEDGTHHNVQVVINLPEVIQKTTDHLFYMIITDFSTATASTRPEIISVNNTVRNFEELSWPGTIRDGYACGGMIKWDTPILTENVTLRFEGFSAGTYTVKRIIIFNDMVIGLDKFTKNFLDFSMFDY